MSTEIFRVVDTGRRWKGAVERRARVVGVSVSVVRRLQAGFGTKSQVGQERLGSLVQDTKAKTVGQHATGIRIRKEWEEPCS